MAAAATITSKWGRQGECGGLENIKYVDTSRASEQICPVVVFASSNTKRPNVAVCSHKSSLFSPISVSLAPAASSSSSSRPLNTSRAAIGPSGCFSARGTRVGGKVEPIRSCECRETGQGTNKKTYGLGVGGAARSMWSESWWRAEMAVSVWLYCWLDSD